MYSNLYADRARPENKNSDFIIIINMCVCSYLLNKNEKLALEF